jgi:hypothetical protein
MIRSKDDKPSKKYDALSWNRRNGSCKNLEKKTPFQSMIENSTSLNFFQKCTTFILILIYPKKKNLLKRPQQLQMFHLLPSNYKKNKLYFLKSIKRFYFWEALHSTSILE